MSTARPTSPAWLLSSLAISRLLPEFVGTSTVDTTDVLVEAGTGNKGLQPTVGEFAGVGFLDLWTSSSSGIGLGMTIGVALLDLDSRLCTVVGTTVNWGWSWSCGCPFSVPSSLP